MQLQILSSAPMMHKLHSSKDELKGDLCRHTDLRSSTAPLMINTSIHSPALLSEGLFSLLQALSPLCIFKAIFSLWWNPLAFQQSLCLCVFDCWKVVAVAAKSNSVNIFSPFLPPHSFISFIEDLTGESCFHGEGQLVQRPSLPKWW